MSESNSDNSGSPVEDVSQGTEREHATVAKTGHSGRVFLLIGLIAIAAISFHTGYVTLGIAVGSVALLVVTWIVLGLASEAKDPKVVAAKRLRQEKKRRQQAARRAEREAELARQAIRANKFKLFATSMADCCPHERRQNDLARYMVSHNFLRFLPSASDPGVISLVKYLARCTREELEHFFALLGGFTDNEFCQFAESLVGSATDSPAPSDGADGIGIGKVRHAHRRYHITTDQFVSVGVKHCEACIIMLTDDENYRRYLDGVEYRYFGGCFAAIKIIGDVLGQLAPPTTGDWNVTIDVNDASVEMDFSMNVQARLPDVPLLGPAKWGRPRSSKGESA